MSPEGLTPPPDVVHELEEPQVQRQFLLPRSARLAAAGAAQRSARHHVRTEDSAIRSCYPLGTHSPLHRAVITDRRSQQL